MRGEGESDGDGDLLGQRKSVPDLQNTFAVLLRKDGQTRQVCELELTDPP